jgi:hypothetical protein
MISSKLTWQALKRNDFTPDKLAPRLTGQADPHGFTLLNKI